MEKNTEILGFDPQELSIFFNNIDDENDITFDEENDIIDDDEIECTYERHIDNCYKNNKKIVRPPYYVYLAGKITSNGWRQEIFDMRNTFCGDDYDEIKLSTIQIRYNFKTNITGPFFLGCDHGCYHGENSHGVGIQCPNGCYGENTLTEKQVYDICTRQINNSNVVFAYIDENTCYGTLWEIGYAKAKGKHIDIVFDNEKLMSNMWFICQAADTVTVLDENTSIKDKFDETINNLSKKNVKKC